MSDYPSAIRSINRTKSALDGTEFLEGQDSLGYFKTPTSAAASAAKSVTTGITASVTQTRVGGTPLTAAISKITVCATAGDAVTLPDLLPGQSAIVFNGGAAAASVFPNAAAVAIDGGAAGAAVTLTNAKRAIFYCIATNVIVSAQLGVPSA